jgi:hypothetical protein
MTMKQANILFAQPKIITTMLLWLLSYFALGQEINKDPQKYIPQPFIDKIELVVGPSLNIPNDHGWAEYVRNRPGDKVTDEVKNKIGYFVGLGLTHSIGKRFEVTARLLYDRKGYKEESTGNNSFYTIDYRYDYFTLVAQPRLQLGKSKKIHVFAGGSFGLLNQSKFEDITYFNGQLVNINISAYDVYAKKYDVNLCLGLGYQLNLNNTKSLLFQLQGNHGISDTKNTNVSNGLRITSQSVILSIAFTHNRRTLYNQIKTNKQ